MRLTDKEGINQSDKNKFKAFKEKSYTGHKKTPTSIDWNQTGNRLLSAENTIRIWSFDESYGLQKLHEIKTTDSIIQCAKFCGQHMFGTMNRDMIKFWDLRINNVSKSIKSQKKTKSDFVSFVWNNNHATSLVAILNKDNIVTIYDHRNFLNSIAILKPNMQINDFCWDRSDSILFMAGGQSNNGSIAMYQTSNYELIPQSLKLHSGRISSISFNLQNTYMATTSQDSLVQLHIVPDLICERCYGNKNDSQYKKSSFSYDGKYLAVTSQDPCIELFNIQKGGLAFKIQCKTCQDNIAWHPKKMVLAYTQQQDKKKIDKNQQGSIKLFTA